MVRLLVTAQWRERRGRHVALAVAYGTAILATFVLLAFLTGARDSVEGPLEDTTTGHLRITQGSHELASGAAWSDVRPVAAELAGTTGAHVSPRWESSQIAFRQDDYEAWSGGVLIGYVPQDPWETDALGRHLAWGHIPTTDVVIGPDEHAYVPLLVGDRAAERLNVTDDPFERPIVLTSGRFRDDAFTIPITKDAVVVGVLDTGVEMLDGFTAFVPLQAARELAGHQPADPVANALVLRGGDTDAARAYAQANGWEAVDAAWFGANFVGAIVVVLATSAAVTGALLLVILLMWLGQATAAAVRADMAVLASLRAVGLSLSRVAGSFAALGGLVVAAGGAAAALAALLFPLVPPMRLDAAGVDTWVALRVPAIAWLAPVGAAVAAAVLAGAVAWWRLGRVPLRQAVEGS